MAFIIIIINVFWPGLGTAISGCVGTKTSGATILLGILQMFLLFIGWIWGIVWSVNLYKKAKADEEGHMHSAPKPDPVTQPPQVAVDVTPSAPPPPPQ